MDFRQTILLYLLIGIGVAIGMASRSKQRSGAMLMVSWLFWPLFVPFLVREPPSDPEKAPGNRLEDAEPIIARISSQIGSDPEIQKRLETVKARWIEQVQWIAEADRLLQELKPVISEHPSSASELRAIRDQAELTLRRMHAELRDFAVAVQVWRAPGAEPSTRHGDLLARLDQLLTLQPQVIP